MNDRIFKRAGLELGDFVQLDWGQNILGTLDASDCTVVVAFGEEVLYQLLGHRDIIRYNGRVIEFKLKSKSLWVIPVIEPQYLLNRRTEDDGKRKRGIRHPPRYQGVVVGYLRKAVDVSREGFQRRSTTYIQDPTPREFGLWVDAFYEAARDAKLVLSWDIETPYKIAEDDEEEYEEEKRKVETKILRISFAYRACEAVSIPWLPEYVADVKRLLSFTGDHLGWNSIAFDGPIMAANNVSVGGRMLDGMDAWHLLQSDLDKGIEFVTGVATDILPWKHLSDALPALYSCIDADAALRNWLWIKEQLEKVGLLERFYTEMEVMEILGRAGRKGNEVNDEFRLELKDELERIFYRKLVEAQGLVEGQFCKHKLYKRIPKGAAPGDYESRDLPTSISVCGSCGKERVSVKHKCPNGTEWEKVKKSILVPHFWKKDPLLGVGDLATLLARLQTDGFNPCSSDQMKRYMRAHNHPVGVNHKTKKDTADVKHLKKLVKSYGKQHPIYQHTLEIRLVQKALTTYVNGLEPDENGTIHTTYVNSPSTWRLGSRNLNVQNLGKRNDNPYAKKARKIIVPRPGHVFLNADSSAIEAVFVGHFMRDEKYIKEARLGIHAGLCCEWLKWEPTRENRELIKKEHADLYDKFKRVVHGVSYGMSPYLMHMNEPDKFPTVASATQLQDFLFKKMPGLPEWHRELQLSAKKNGYLDNPWKLRHYFYDVFNYAHDEDGNMILDRNGLPKIKLGKDGKRVIAFKPQSSGGLFMRDNIILLNKTDAKDWLTAVTSIHDGYCAEVPEDKVDKAKQILIDILTRPIPEMDNLQVGCEVEIGISNFLEMEKIAKVEIA